MDKGTPCIEQGEIRTTGFCRVRVHFPQFFLRLLSAYRPVYKIYRTICATPTLFGRNAHDISLNYAFTVTTICQLQFDRITLVWRQTLRWRE